MEKENTGKGTLPVTLAWLADAPLFIDDDFVRRFYDAIIQPEFEGGEITFTVDKNKASKVGGKLGLEAQVSPGKVVAWLSTLLPFLDAKLKAGGEVRGESSRTEGETTQVVLRQIKTPQRQLIQLVLHYLINHEDRLFALGATGVSKQAWPSTKQILSVPRAIIFLDIPQKASIIPAAAEFKDGVVVPLYLQLRKEDGQNPPPYPEKGTPEQLAEERKEYWAWFNQNIPPSKAMSVVEDASTKNGRIRWIDYRVLLTDQGDSVHLHVCPAGNYDTGVLAYNLIKRGNKHGLRIIGTLKAEPDINVMAIYEK